ncbi:FCD domain-containing protein, partial [Thioclava sp. BHET1]
LVTDVDIATMGQVYQLRMELAEMTSRLSPVEITAAQLAGMEEIARRSKEVVANPAPRAFAQLNIDFFEARIALSANEPLREISRLLYYQTSRIWLQSISAHRIELQEEAHIFDREVEDFLRALKLGDLQAATLIHR